MKIKFDTEIFGKQFIYFDSISSTNDYVKNNIDKYSRFFFYKKGKENAMFWKEIIKD